jgi:polar amino acid transport system substrate-binding protein
VTARSFTALVGVLVCGWLSTAARSDADRLLVAYPQWPPYKIVQNGSIGGIDALVLDEVARRTGLEFEYVECPWARCLILLENGSVDMITSIARTPERAAVMDFLEPPTRDNYAISFYTHAASAHALNRYEDLSGLDVGMIRGSAYFERFDQDQKIRKIAFTQEKQLIDMLASRRIDVILGIGANLDYLLQEMGRGGVVRKWSLRIETKDPAYVAVSKRSKHQGAIPRLEQTLREMRRANEIERIEQNFLKALARDRR